MRNIRCIHSFIHFEQFLNYNHDNVCRIPSLSISLFVRSGELLLAGGKVTERVYIRVRVMHTMLARSAHTIHHIVDHTMKTDVCSSIKRIRT